MEDRLSSTPDVQTGSNQTVKQPHEVSQFKDSQFEEAADELENPKIDGWELLIQTDEVRVYRFLSPDSGLYSYKTVADFSGILPELWKDVYMDLEYRKKWDSYVKELFVVAAKDGGGGNDGAIYWNVNYPFPMWNRDYVYARRLKEVKRGDKTMFVILGESLPGGGLEKVKEKKSVVRVEKYHQFLVITSNGKRGTKAFIHYYDDPKGSIPTWLINWAAKTGVPAFIKTMKDACHKFPQ